LISLDLGDSQTARNLAARLQNLNPQMANEITGRITQALPSPR
jgi:hypothetical protein